MTSEAVNSAPIAHADVLVLDYLAALWAVTDDVEPHLRDELMTAVADHIAMRRVGGAAGADPTEVLRRLGPVEALADSVRRGHLPIHLRRPAQAPMPMPVAAPPGAAGTGADYAALALLTAGSVVLPVAGPLAGLVLMSASPRWNPAPKVAAWMLAAGPMALALAIFLMVAWFGSGFEGMLLAYVLMVAGAFLAALTLLPGFTSHRTAYHS